ncbi:hypothetical protein OV450_3511 [Actinobacteria bacterium OV450]|nr:hypothetical protein OV450_3511 [Actinobacteria bacterium OV450]
MPPMAIDLRMGRGKMNSAASDVATVAAEKATARPAVDSVACSESSTERPLPSSSRKRLMMKRL